MNGMEALSLTPVSSRLPALDPEFLFKTKPFNHQLTALQLSQDSPAFALFMEQGTGKSKVILDTATMLFRKGLITGLVIVAPKSVCLSWTREEIPAHIPDSIQEEEGFRVLRALTGRLLDKLASLPVGQWSSRPGPGLKILVTNPETLIPRGKDQSKGYKVLTSFMKAYHCLMVVDESQSIKHHTAKRTKAIIRLGQLAPYRRIATGTPIANNWLDLYSQFLFLSPDILGYTSFYAFKARYAVLRKVSFDGVHTTEIIAKDKQGRELFQNTEELQAKIAPCSYRIMKKDCLDLPEKIYQKVYVDMAPEQAKVYDSLKTQARAELLNGAEVTVQHALTQLLRLHQVVSGWTKDDTGQVHQLIETPPKLAALLEIVEGLNPDTKVIIWATYSRDIENIVKALNQAYGPGSAAAFNGQTKDKDRTDILINFKDPHNKLRFFVGQPQAGGAGLTLVSASYVVYYSNNHNLIHRLQTEDRAHRIGQTHNVTYIDLIAPGTVDEHIVTALRNKEDIASTFSNGLKEKLQEWLS